MQVLWNKRYLPRVYTDSEYLRAKEKAAKELMRDLKKTTQEEPDKLVEPISGDVYLAKEEMASRAEIRAELRSITPGVCNISEARATALTKGGCSGRSGARACLECTRREGGRLAADELLEQEAAQKTGSMVKDQLEAAVVLCKEVLEHCSMCDEPCEGCKELHEP